MHYNFDDCTLDTQRYELRQGGVRMPAPLETTSACSCWCCRSHRSGAPDPIRGLLLGCGVLKLAVGLGKGRCTGLFRVA
jgi:hypothetical protein